MEVSREEGLTIGLTKNKQLYDYSSDLKDATTQKLDKRASRIWPATYACIVAAVGFLVLGYSLGYNSPVSSHLKHRKGYTSLRRTLDQDLFGVSGVVLISVANELDGFADRVMYSTSCYQRRFGTMCIFSDHH